MGNEDLNAVNWEELGYGQVKAEIMEMAVAPLEAFFAAHTKEEFTRGSVERRILLFPVAMPRDILNHPQLKARDYFKEVFHPELNVPVPYPGPFVKSEGEELVGLRRRPPLVGEHNPEIYQQELGLTLEQLTTLREGGVI